MHEALETFLTIEILFCRRVTTTIYTVGHANSISVLYAGKLFAAVQIIMGLTSANNTQQIEFDATCVSEVGFGIVICDPCYCIISPRTIIEESRAFVDFC